MGEVCVTNEPKPETGNPTRARALTRVTADITLEQLMNAIGDFLDDNAQGMTCAEAMAVADAYGTTGRDPEAFLENHSWGDNEPDDLHYDPEKQQGGMEPEPSLEDDEEDL